MRLFKQFTLAALLLALSVSSFAAPPGWVERGNNKHRNAGVAADRDAIERGSSLDVDLDTLTIDLAPWVDADNDLLTGQVILPDGVTLTSTFSEVGWGWSANMSNGWKLWFVDLEYSRVTEGLALIMPGFDAQGVAAVFGGIPVSEIPASGEWRIPKLLLGGSVVDDIRVDVQEIVTPLPGEIVNQEDWVIGSVSIRHNSKRNNITGVGNYMTGKIAHLPAPLCVFWKGGSPHAHVFGWYEYDPVTKILTKVFDAAELLAAKSNSTSMSISVDLGVTTVGGSNSSLGGDGVRLMDSTGPLVLAENYTLQTMNVYYSGIASVTPEKRLNGLYQHTGALGSGTLDYIAGNTGEYSLKPTVGGGTNGWQNRSPLVANESLASGLALNFSTSDASIDSAGVEEHFDTTSASTGVYQASGAVSGSGTNSWYPPNDISGVSDLDTTRGYSWYISVTVAVIPTGGGDTGPLNLGLGLQL